MSCVRGSCIRDAQLTSAESSLGAKPSLVDLRVDTKLRLRARRIQAVEIPVGGWRQVAARLVLCRRREYSRARNHAAACGRAKCKRYLLPAFAGKSAMSPLPAGFLFRRALGAVFLEPALAAFLLRGLESALLLRLVAYEGIYVAAELDAHRRREQVEALAEHVGEVPLVGLRHVR